MRTYLHRLRLALKGQDIDCGHRWDDAVRMQTVLGQLSDRYLQIADKATTDLGKARAVQIRQAGNDIRHALITGRLPHWLMTDAELEQHGTPEEAAS